MTSWETMAVSRPRVPALLLRGCVTLNKSSPASAHVFSSGNEGVRLEYFKGPLLPEFLTLEGEAFSWPRRQPLLVHPRPLLRVRACGTLQSCLASVMGSHPPTAVTGARDNPPSQEFLLWLPPSLFLQFPLISFDLSCGGNS